MKFGYARISTHHQSLENQIANLEKEECDKIFADKISGYKQHKPEFEEMMKQIRSGDTIVVTRVDRLGRSTKDLLILLDELHDKNVHLLILSHRELDTRSAWGKLLFTSGAMFAENERMLTIERIKQGMEGAKKKGRPIGRGRKLNKEKMEKLFYLYETTKLSLEELCLMYNITKRTFYNYLTSENIKLKRIKNLKSWKVKET